MWLRVHLFNAFDSLPAMSILSFPILYNSPMQFPIYPNTLAQYRTVLPTHISKCCTHSYFSPFSRRAHAFFSSSVFSLTFFPCCAHIFLIRLIIFCFSECTFLLLLFPQFIAPAPPTEAPIDLAKKCDHSECSLPYCFCSKDGTVIPGGLDAQDVSNTRSHSHI